MTLDRNLAGAGTFQFNNRLVLTRSGYSRSRWELPDFFKTMRISYHSKDSFVDGYFDSAKIGQEFVVEENARITDWALKLIRAGAPPSK